MTPSPIECERLTLRQLCSEHAGSPYLGWMSDADVTRYLEARFRTLTEADLRLYIEAANADPGILLYGIFLRGVDTHIGNIKLGPILSEHRRADVGLIIGEKRLWGRGYASEAIRGLADHAFGALGLHKLSAGFYAANQASIRSFEKAGFTHEARLPSHWFCGDAWMDYVLLGLVNDVD